MNKRRRITKDLRPRVNQKPTGLAGAFGSMFANMLDTMLVDEAVQELRTNWKALQLKEPVQHVFFYWVRTAILLCRKNPHAATTLAYVLAKEFTGPLFEMQEKAGL